MDTRLRGGGIECDIGQYLSLKHLRGNGKLRRISPDGNCLFRAIAAAYYNDVNMHKHVRAEIVTVLGNLQQALVDDPTVYTQAFTLKTTGGADGSYGAYMKHIATADRFGDTGCLHVFSLLYTDFTYCVWHELIDQSNNEKFLRRYVYIYMNRCCRFVCN